MKAKSAEEVKKCTDIPNIGPAMVADFRVLNISTPQELKKHDAFTLYTKLCKVTGKRHDPCVLDTFLAAVDFMRGAPAKPWWAYTAQRKKTYPHV
jgi:hypothetical protein